MDSCLRPSSFANFSFIDQNQFSELDMNFLSIITSSGDTFFSHQPSSGFSLDVVGNFHHATGDNLQISNTPAIPVGGAATSAHHHQVQPNIIVAKAEDETCETKKRKAGDASRSSSPTTSCLTPSPRKGKKVKINGEEEREVIHVRARRGQATDSHSLAERVRRGKINERLRCLQDIVPGCYKTMGMAMMLDEIITYVHSLQNQVEFLSMKLTAASSFHDFNSDTNVIEMMQRAKAEEAQEMERLMREGYGGGSSCFDSTTTTWPQ